LFICSLSTGQPKPRDGSDGQRACHRRALHFLDPLFGLNREGTCLSFGMTEQCAVVNSTVKKHSILIGRRITSISLEDVFWISLQQIARGRQVTRSDLIASVDAARKNTNLSSAIRVFILNHYRASGRSGRKNPTT
jgi:predicted DNA-binding ribbon-helix-helix protein